MPRLARCRDDPNSSPSQPALEHGHDHAVGDAPIDSRFIAAAWIGITIERNTAASNTHVQRNHEADHQRQAV